MLCRLKLSLVLLQLLQLLPLPHPLLLSLIQSLRESVRFKMKKYKLIGRIAADIFIIVLIAWSPLWAIIIFSIVFAWIFAPYYEVIIWGLAFDALYGLHSVYGVIFALGVFIIIEVLKRKTRI